jgi:hypothetical protein
LVKQGEGVREAFSQRDLTKRELDGMGRRMSDAGGTGRVDADYLHRMMGHFIAVGLDRGAPPPSQLLSTNEGAGRGYWMPDRVSPADEIERLKAADPGAFIPERTRRVLASAGSRPPPDATLHALGPLGPQCPRPSASARSSLACWRKAYLCETRPLFPHAPLCSSTLLHARSRSLLILPPLARRDTAPAPECTREGTRVGVVECLGDLVNLHPGVFEHLPRYLEAALIQELLVACAACIQAPTECATVYREELGDLV